MNEIDFLDRGLKIFPDLRESFEELEGLFHLQLEAFDYRTKEEIKKYNEEKVVDAFALVQQCFRHGTDHMKSAVDTSFAESITFGVDEKARLWAWKKFPEELKDLHIKFWGEAAVRQRLGRKRIK